MNIDLSHVGKHRFADENDFLRLVSAQIVLKVLNDSIQVLEKSSPSPDDAEIGTSTTPRIAPADKNNNKEINNENYVNMRKHFNIKRWSVKSVLCYDL